MATLLPAEQRPNPWLRRKHVSMRPPAGSILTTACARCCGARQGAHGSHPVMLDDGRLEVFTAIACSIPSRAAGRAASASVPT